MRKALSVSALAKSAGVTTKTLRYWEGLGLLPRANRTHTGYRVFARLRKGDGDEKTLLALSGLVDRARS